MTFDEKITFIVCCPRSGSTWLRLLINSHPEIACENETFIFTQSAGIGNIFKAYDLEFGFKGLRRYLTKEDLIRFSGKYLEDIFQSFLEKRKKKFIVEKSVDHALCIPFIKSIFPNSKFIHLVRDGRDVAISLNEASKNWKSEYPNNLNAAMEMWLHYNSTIDFHLSTLDPNNFITIKYENLVKNTQNELVKLFNFIKARELSDVEISKIVSANDFSVLKSKYRSWGNGHFFRSGLVNEWKTKFTAEEITSSINRIGDLLKKYDYDTRSA
ncbi:MAG: sulfotransferase [Bacteroidetes bacterium]|nr:sulfotransferase [Bacteroidota bacterium]